MVLLSRKWHCFVKDIDTRYGFSVACSTLSLNTMAHTLTSVAVVVVYLEPDPL